MQDYSKVFLDFILKDKEIITSFEQLSQNPSQSIKNQIREKLFNDLKEYYAYMKSRGVLQLHFHLSDGTSFLRMHKPEKFGDYLLGFRFTIKQVLDSHKPALGYEIGKYFDGFRYVYPIMEKEKYLGSVEVSIASQKFIKDMNQYINGTFLMILKKKYIDDVMDTNRVGKDFHQTCFSEEYYMNNALHKDIDFDENIIKKNQKLFIKKLQSQKSFAVASESHIFLFKSLSNYQQEPIGYSIEILQDDRIHKILINSLSKFFLVLLAFFLIIFFYSRNRKNLVELEQFKDFVDEISLVSKADLVGRITYANSKFLAISGYTQKELLGKPHNIVRDKSMPKEVFKELWNTIQHGKTWKGKVTNKAKDGSNYTVDAVVAPLFNEKGKIVEYISLRHDITELESYRKLLESKLDKTSENLQKNIALVNQYQDAIESASAFMRINLDGVITYVNNTMLHISNYKEDEVINNSIIDIGLVTKEMFVEINNAILKNTKWSGVIECHHEDKQSCYIDAVFSPIVENKEIKEFICISHDVTPIYDLYKEIEDTQREVVFTMGAIGESRSKETGHHVKRVAEYSYLLGKLSGLSQEECDLLKQASPMHDIGKVGIPDSILNKPGKLTDDEFRIMKTHAKLGYNMLKHSQRDILKAAATIAYEHHEKYNAKGYPRGLKGDEIHIYGRITAIADVFDALGSDRCYKKAWEMDKILQFFEEEKGESFDPMLVELFLDNIDEFLLIRSIYKDIYAQ